jgi:predicted MPP superfamily phosphohydrolase
MWLFALVFASVLVTSVYGWLEAGWLRKRVREVHVEGLPETLDGVRIGHLSDLHLGAPGSLGNRAGVRAARWLASRRPDLVCVTGDLVSHPRGNSRLDAVMTALDRPLVVLGNHDVAMTRDPFSRAADGLPFREATVLRDELVTIRVRGESIAVAGVDPASYLRREARPQDLGAEDGFRLLLCHYPGIVDRVPAGSFDLILAGHLHAGQICVALPGRRITLAHPHARFVSGLYETPAGVMHVSPGTGTTFVPFRFFARPEVTELVLRRRTHA